MQTFPADYKWVGNKTDREQMVGNAVPVKLAEYVANAIAEHIRAIPASALEGNGFKNWLRDEKGMSERSSGDVVSHVKRASRIVPYEGVDVNEYCLKLSKSEEYKVLPATVRSQIKRSMRLFDEYLRAAA